MALYVDKLMHAINTNSVLDTALFLTRVNSIDLITNGLTPLANAIYKGFIHIVNVLLEAGANPNLRLPNNSTHLEIAIMRQDRQSIDALLTSGADPNMCGRHFFTPLMYAAYFGDLEVTRLLLEHGADPLVTNKDGDTPLLIALKQKEYAVCDMLTHAGLTGSTFKGISIA